METKQRQVSFEVLRILAMCMIITLHYLSKGGFLASLTGFLTVNAYIAWGIEAFCLVAVNVYILISGYFGSQKEVRFNKVIHLWIQVFTYAIVLGILAFILGVASSETIDIYTLMQLCFPIVTEHYWFATSYIFLLLLMPFLNAGVEKLSKKDLQKIMAVLLLLFSIAKTFLPMHLPWDKLGYDVLWFVCLYLTGAYIHKYGLPGLKGGLQCALLYIITSLLTFASAMLLRAVYLKTGSLGDFVSYAYSYNHVLCYLGAIGLFGIFYYMKQRDGKYNDMIVKISGCTFGVYLLHEHLWIRTMWPKWLGTDNMITSYWFIPHMVASVAVVFLVGTVAEYGRKIITAKIENSIMNKGRGKR